MSGHGQHPFDEYFDRDYVSGDEWWDNYQDATREFTISGFGMRQSWDPHLENLQKPGQKGAFKDKPVMYLVEHGDKAIFLNRTNHTILQGIFGRRYYENDGSAVRGKTLRITCYEKRGREGMNRIIEIVGPGEISKVLGEQWADRFLGFLGQNELGVSDFFWWLNHVNQGALAASLSELKIEDWPKIANPWMVKYAEAFKDSPDGARKPR